MPLTVPGDVAGRRFDPRRRFMEGLHVRYVKKLPLRAEGRSGGTFWVQWRLRVAESAPRRATARFKNRAGSRSAYAHRQDRPARNRKFLPGLAAHTQFLPQQTRPPSPPPLADARGDRDRGRHRRRACRGDSTFPTCSTRCWILMRAGSSPSRRTPSVAGDQAFLHRKRLYCSTTPAEHTGLMRNMIVRTASTGEVGDRGFQQRRPAPHHASQQSSGCEVPGNHVAVLHRQHEIQRLAGRPDPVCYALQGPHYRGDGGAVFQGRAPSRSNKPPTQAHELYKVARRFGGPRSRRAYDPILEREPSLISAPPAAPKSGAEYNREAIADAKVNRTQWHRQHGFLCRRHESGRCSTTGSPAAERRPDVTSSSIRRVRASTSW